MVIKAILILLMIATVFYTCYRLCDYNKYINKLVKNSFNEDLADKLLSITTEDQRKVPYFSVEDKQRIKDKWRKEGYL